MKFDQNIKDTIKASAIIMTVIVLIVIGIEFYIALTGNEAEEINGFLTLAISLHNDIDENNVRDDILGLIDNISKSQINNPEEINQALMHGSYLMNNYKARFYVLVSPSEAMRTLKESLIEEGGLFLGSYYYAREAWESKNNDKYDVYLSNIQKAEQYLGDAMNLRVQNTAELNQWKMIVEAQLAD